MTINRLWTSKSRMTFALPSPTQAGAPLSVAALRAWIVRARPGEWLEYHRGLLAIDRVEGASSLKEPERRKLAAVADQALALADRGKLHLLQERHGNGDYSYWAVARAPARSVSHFSIDRRSPGPRP
jgi:hypothetical protein